MHSCEPWISQNISCPEGLIQGARKSGGGGDGLGELPPDDEVEQIHERELEPSVVPLDGEQIETEVMIELEKRIQAERSKSADSQEEREHEVQGFGEFRRRTPREETVERLKEQEVRVPAEIVREAVRQGARNPELSRWVAAAALLLAAPGAILAVPGTVRGVSSALRGMRGSAGVGFRFNDRARIDALMGGAAKKLLVGDGIARTGAGEFFPGTEG